MMMTSFTRPIPVGKSKRQLILHEKSLTKFTSIPTFPQPPQHGYPRPFLTFVFENQGVYL